MTDKKYTLGIDIGSTTVKIAILDEENQLLFADYERHFANIQETLAHLLGEAHEKLGELTLQPVITGSGGLALAAPQTDVAIELGGEDAKIIYFEGGNVEQRMNGICAGGTGSFIDQMASLLQTDATGLNEYAKHYQAIYPIAARCGVFAKTDIQPLINDGATKEDLSASIFQAVVNQTISGLACGKPIRGHVAFLGGPLHFLSELKTAFVRTLKLDDEHTIVPDNSHLFAAIGSARNADGKTEISLLALKKRLEEKVAIFPPTKETAISVLMPVPRRPKLLSSAKTVLFSIPSTATTTEIRSAHRSARSRRSTPNCRIPHRSPGPVRPVTARRSSKLH